MTPLGDTEPISCKSLRKAGFHLTARMNRPREGHDESPSQPTLKDKIIPVTSKVYCNNLMMYQCHGNVVSCVYISQP